MAHRLLGRGMACRRWSSTPRLPTDGLPVLKRYHVVGWPPTYWPPSIVFKVARGHTKDGREGFGVNGIGESGGGEGRPQRVLVVDDEVDILDSVKSLIESATENVEVTTAGSGPAALEKMASSSFDLILTDYKMPQMNGLEFLAEARRVAPRTARIMLTAFPDLDLALSALNDERIEKFLVKPIEPEELLNTVQDVLDRRRRTSESAAQRAKDMADARRKKPEGP